MSVVIKNRIELHDKPVAVCHSDNPKGTAEISSANYPARAYGLSYMKVTSLKLSCAMGLDIYVFGINLMPFSLSRSESRYVCKTCKGPLSSACYCSLQL